MIEMRIQDSQKKHITIPALCKTIPSCLICLTFIASCSNDKPDKIGAIVDRTKLPRQHVTDFTTIISDSGITRYRISASRWDFYDKAIQPYQEFPDGIYLEKFDENMKVDANIQSNYARFNENDQIWELRGKVRAMNLQGELFETQQLFWNQRQARFYSDSLIKITQATRLIIGTGFESNESMTRYIIKKTQGIFPLNENAGSSAPQPVTNSQATPSVNSSGTATKTTFPPVKATPVAPPFNKIGPQSTNPGLPK